MKILIAVPCMENVSVRFTESILNMDKPKGTDSCLNPGSLVYDSRNMLSLTAISGKYDYTMWLDSDMTFPKNTITQLIQDAQEYNVNMVTGLYVQRTYPTFPVIYDNINPPAENAEGQLVKQLHEYVDYKPNSVFPVSGCGFGCVLTSTKLLKAVWDKFGPAFMPVPWAGEDIAFCYRVQQLNETILCDSRISCGHVGSFLYTEQMLKRGDET